MGSPENAALRHSLNSLRAVVQSLETDLVTLSPLARPDIELLISFFKDAEQNAQKDIELHELTHGGIDARKKACVHPERYISNAPAPPLDLRDSTPPRLRQSREEMIASKRAELESELQKAEARSSDLKKTVDDWYLHAFPEWETVTADARARWTNGLQFAIEQYDALKLHHKQVLGSQNSQCSGNLKSHAGVTMPGEISDRPFQWSEIHDLAEKKLAELDQAIRAEIGKPVSPVPAGGGTRHRFFVLLGERADDWAARAAKTYKDCLAQIGRADAPGATYAVWLNGLRFFLTENLMRLLRLACGFGSREQELLGFYSRKYPTPHAVIEVRVKAHEIQRIVDRISKQCQNQALHPNGGWLEQLTRTLDEVKKQNPQPASVSQPIIAPAPMQPSDDSISKNKSSQKEALLKRIQAAPSGMTFRYEDAACAFDVTKRTIPTWADEGKLDQGARRGTVTAESLKRELRIS